MFTPNSYTRHRPVQLHVRVHTLVCVQIRVRGEMCQALHTAVPRQTHGRKVQSTHRTHARTHARTHERPHARRSKEKSIDKSDDYKQLVTHFAEDLQATLNAVEWPAAEVSLQLLTAGLIKLCKGEAAAEQAVHRNLALQLLGNIARSTRREVVRACVHMCMCMCGCVRRHGAFLHDAWRGVPV